MTIISSSVGEEAPEGVMTSIHKLNNYEKLKENVFCWFTHDGFYFQYNCI
jgi:hypothetical protein